jgi:hypothetical protein
MRRSALILSHVVDAEMLHLFQQAVVPLDILVVEGVDRLLACRNRDHQQALGIEFFEEQLTVHPANDSTTLPAALSGTPSA